MHAFQKEKYMLYARVLAFIGALAGICAADGRGSPAHAQGTDGKSTFEIYGFAQADLIFATSKADPDWKDGFRPSKISTNPSEFGSGTQTSISVKQSRFGVQGGVPVSDDLGAINFKFEFDMFGVGADAGQTTIRLRHAFGEWGQILAGQTNTVFMDIDVFPNVIEYWGPPGMVFFRNPQLRWTPYQSEHNQIAIALERPGNDVDVGQIRDIDPGLGENVQASQHLPDLTAHWRVGDPWGHFQVAGILRQLGFETPGNSGNDPSGTKMGWGVNVSGHVNLFRRDKLMGQVVFGRGIASYMNDGGVDLAPQIATTDIHAKAVPLLGVMAYYDHNWNDRWSTSIGYSFTEVDNTNLQQDNAFEKGEYGTLNLLWTPKKNIMIGGEVTWGQRTDKNGATGDDVRFQFSVKYNFGANIPL